MGRKGGRARGFIKNIAKKLDGSDSEDEPAEAPAPVNGLGTKANADDADATQTPDAPAQVTVDEKDSLASTSEEASSANGAARETRGQMMQRHKRELKELKDQAKRAGKKAKDDFKLKESEMVARHEIEMVALESEAKAAEAEQNSPSPPAKDPNKKSKAQRRREKLEAIEREKQAAIDEEIANMGETERAIEEKELQSVLISRGLHVVEIPGDGHCMYRSLAHQCEQKDVKHFVDDQDASTAYQVLRDKAAHHIRSHGDEFIPFILDEASSAPPEEQLEAYCKQVQGLEWGTQVELQALATVLGVRIQVFSAALECYELGKEHPSEPALQVCHLQKAYGAGAHYNSVAPIPLNLSGEVES